MYRLILVMESRIRRNVYVRFGGEYLETYCSNTKTRWILSLLLEKHGLFFNDINLFVFHQANKYMVNFIRKIIGIDKEKFYLNIEDVGNTVSSTIPIALYEAKKEGKLNGNIMLAGFGVGYSWAGVLLRCL